MLHGNAVRTVSSQIVVRSLIIAISAAMIGYHVFVLITRVPDPYYFRPIHVAFVLILGLLSFGPDGERRARLPDAFTIVVIIAAAYSLVHFALSLDRILERLPYISPIFTEDRIAAASLMLAILEVCRRTIGWTLPIIAIIVILHAWIGGGPFFINHPGVDLDRIVDHLYLTTSGLFGSIVSLSASDIFAFTLFGSALILAKGNQAFMDIALKTTRGSKGGPAKASIIGSASFGMISGSAIANIYTTGSVTIPLMKSRGFPAHVAAAFEATASNVGNWMPPVMGTAAFLVADFTGRSYGYIALIAIVPALLYVLGLYVSAHFIGSKMLRDGEARLDADSRPETLRYIVGTWWHLLLPLVVLVALLAVGITSYIAALWATGVTILVAQFRKSSRFDIPELGNALQDFAMAVVPIAAALIVASLVVAGLEVTGITLKFASAMLSLTGGNLHLTLLLVAASGIVLGMGLPNVAAYVVTMVFGVPALTELGIDPLVAHMYVFYFANLCSITPPVALASYAAASIARASVLKTSLAAVRLALPAFILPFIIAYNPVLLLQGEPLQIAQGIVTAVIAVIALAAANEGWLLGAPAGPVSRVLLFASGILLIVPGFSTDAIGFALLGAALIFRTLKARRTAAATRSGPNAAHDAPARNPRHQRAEEGRS